MATLGMLLVLLSTTGVAMASDCYYTISEYNLVYASLKSKSESFNCSDRCCGYSGYYYCCTDISSASAAMIAGMAIGSLAAGGLFVALFKLCINCIIAKRRSGTPTTGRGSRTPVTRRVIGTPATRAQTTYINTYSDQPGNTVQPEMQPFCNQGFTPDASTVGVGGDSTVYSPRVMASGFGVDLGLTVEEEEEEEEEDVVVVTGGCGGGD